MSAMRAGVELLPIGAMLDLGGRELKILALLSDAGATGDVYAGALGPDGEKVAVKVAKDGVAAGWLKRFEDERVTLATLGPAADQLGDEYGIEWQVVPRYLGKGSYQGRELFAMEFVAGESVPDLLAARGRLDELQALSIALQLFFVLEVLHTRQMQTYIDLKFENLRWVDGMGGAAGQLKVLDFGTLEKIDPGDLRARGVRRDLLLGSCYLCAMITGEMPRYSAAGLLSPADELIRKGAMSSGVRHLLSNLLHRNPLFRPKTAADIFQELWVLLNYWSLPEAAVLAEARKELDAAEDGVGGAAESVQKHARLAQSALDIVVLRTPGQAANLSPEITRVKQLLAASDYYARGRALFDGRAYTKARGQFDLGRDWGSDTAFFRRWSYLALAGQTIDTELFGLHCPDAIKLAEYLNAGQLAAARLRLESLEPIAGQAGISALAADLQLFEQLERAEGLAGRDFAAAGRAYLDALSALDRLPDRAVAQSEVGDLQLRVEEMAELHAREGRTLQLLADAHSALLRLDPKAAIDNASQAFLGQSADPQRTAELLRLINVAFAQRDYNTACELAVIGLFKAPDNGEVLRHLKFARLLARATAQVESGAENGCGRSIRAAYDLFPAHAAALPAARVLRDGAFEAAKHAANYQLLRELAELSEAIGDVAWAADKRKLAAAYEAEFQVRAAAAIDRLLAEAHTWLLLVEVDTGGARRIASEWSIAELKQALHNPAGPLRQARKAHDSARAIAPAVDYRRQEMDDVLRRIDKAAGASKAHLFVEPEGAETDGLARLALQLELVRKLTGELRSAPAAQDKRAELAKYAAEFFGACERSGAVSGTSVGLIAAMRREAEQLLDGGGLRAWKAVQAVAGGHIARLQQEFAAARAVFEGGNLQLAESELERLAAEFDASDEWLGLKTAVVRAEQWVQWERANGHQLRGGRSDAGWLKLLRGQLGEKLPAPYYSEVLKKLQAASAAARSALGASLLAESQDVQFEHFRKWVDVEVTMRRISG